MKKTISQNRRPVSGNTGWQKTVAVLKKIWYVLSLTGKLAYKTRSVLLAIPVAVCAVALAIRNARLLPQVVWLNVQLNGGAPIMVTRGIAVMFPLALTALCLLLMFCSKRTLYPWLISVLSLVLPLVIWMLDVFAA